MPPGGEEMLAFMKTVAIFLVLAAAVGINLPEEMLEETGISSSFLLGLLFGLFGTWMSRKVPFLVAAVVLILAFWSFVPASGNQVFGMDQNFLLLVVATLIGTAVTRHVNVLAGGTLLVLGLGLVMPDNAAELLKLNPPQLAGFGIAMVLTPLVDILTTRRKRDPAARS